MEMITLGVFCESDDAVESAKVECSDLDLREESVSCSIVSEQVQDGGVLLTVRMVGPEYEGTILEAELNGWSGVEVTDYEVG